MRVTSAPVLLESWNETRQASDVRLHLFAQLGDHALRGFREKLRERVGSDALHQRGAEQNEDEREEILRLVLAEDVVHDEFR